VRCILPCQTWYVIYSSCVFVHEKPYIQHSFLLSRQDRYSGLLPRWHVNFNITMLRLISYGMDYHWAVQQQPSAHRLSSTPASLVHVSPPTGYKERVKTSLPLHEYSLINFFTYAVYPALYIAGPIMSFNDFTWQIKRPSATPPRALFSYALRFLACILTMEVVLHYMYVVAIKDAGAWEGDTPAELSMIGLWNLIVVWLKVRSFTNALIQDCFADILCENEKKSCSCHGASSACGHSQTG
jgi:D-alanyl-lipoteichoic acid acyltransferase DltB (MBOAT superfamily)